MALDTLKDLYIDQLQDLHSACEQSRDVVGDLAEAAHDPELRDALKAGVAGIEDGIATLKTVLEGHGADPAGAHCKGMEGLAAEARAHGLQEEFGDKDVQDAMIITQYQRMTHYALAGYGSCVAFAKRLGLHEDATRIGHNLDKTYDGDRRFTDIATSGVNRDATRSA